MPKQVSKSSLAAKLGDKGRQAFDAHKDDEVNFGSGGDLPAGIEGGIAQVVECKFDRYKEGNNKGEYFFYAAAIVMKPVEVGDIRVKGLRTSITEPLCDTPTRKRATVDDHLAWVLNELKKLGADTSEVGFDDLEDVAAAIKEEQPYTRFRTWRGTKQEITKREDGKWECGGKIYPSEAVAKAANPFVGSEPRVQHEWRGKCDYEGDDGDEGVDETVAEEPAAEPAKVPPKKPPKVATKAKEPDPEPEPDAEEQAEENDLDALVEAADGGDEPSQIKLAEMAKDAGCDEDAVANAENWAAVGEMITAAGASEEAEEAAAEWEPKKGEIVLYKPPKAKKKVECEVVAIFKDKGIVNLKNLDDNAIYKGVKMDVIEASE
jgi:hypothetical protein